MKSTSTLLVALASVFQLTSATDRSTTVDLGYSKYEGISNNNGITRWSGIRYAAAPVGNLRFRAAQDPVSTGNQVISAKTIPKACINSPSTAYNATLQDEDCLFLDVYTPSSQNKTNLPVYIWIQGGGMNTQQANADGTKFVINSDFDIVFVSFNYRVGPFGFLTSKESQADGDLNVGILDQRKVMHWVQKHIDKFGGDPKKVTISGSSAGGGSVGIHMTAYGGKDQGLFAAAHAESPSFGYVRTVEQSQYQYDGLVKRVNCTTANNTLSCLRSLSADTLASRNINFPTTNGANGLPAYMWSNVIDGNLIRDQTYRQFGAGNFTKIPTIYGADTNEGQVFTRKDIDNTTALNAWFKDNFPQITDQQLGVVNYLYPKGAQYPNRGSYFSAAGQAYGEMRYMCSSLNVSSLLTEAAVHSVYQYHYAVFEDANAASGDGTTHAQAVNPFWGASPATSRAAGVSPAMQGYFFSFIKTGGDPNKLRKSGSPVWYTYNQQSMQRMLFPNDPAEVGMEYVSVDLRAKCKYWSEIGPSIGQ